MLIRVFHIWTFLTQELTSCREGGGKASHLFPTFHRLPPLMTDCGESESLVLTDTHSSWGENTVPQQKASSCLMCAKNKLKKV